MKKLIFIALIGVFTAFQVNAQDNDKLKNKDVPDVVRTAFDKQFDKAMLVDWKMKNGNYKASFTKDLKKHMAEFNSSGELLSKGEKINKDELPTSVADALKTGYASSKIDDVYRIEKGGQTQYMIKLDDPDKKVIYDTEGNIVKEKMHKK